MQVVFILVIKLNNSHARIHILNFGHTHDPITSTNTSRLDLPKNWVSHGPKGELKPKQYIAAPNLTP